MLSRQLPCRPSVARCPGPARPGERASRELAALAGVPDVGQHVTGERFLQCVNGMHGFPRDGAPMREYLLAQSTAAGRYTNPLAIGMYAVSSAHAWLARSIFRQRSRYGQLLCCALRRLVFGLQYSASTPMRFINVRTRRRPTSRPFRRNRRASIRASANGNSMYGSSMRRIGNCSASLTGCARVIHARSRDANQPRLLRNRQRMRMVDHRFTLSNPDLVSVPLKNHSPAPIGRSLHAAYSHRWLARRRACRAKHVRRALLQLPLPFRDLVRMHIELLRQFGQRALALDRRQGHFRFEHR